MAEPVIELGRVAEAANIKRQALVDAARRRTSITKILNLISGVFALLAAGSISTVITDYACSSLAVKIFAAILSFSSGVITLVSSIYYRLEDTKQIFEGAAKFHHIWETADLARERPDITAKQAFADLSRIRPQYRNASSQFDQYLPINVIKRSPYTGISSDEDDV